jgi:protease secretion system outer membrane protein
MRAKLPRRIASVALAVIACAAAPARGYDLLDAYRDALAHDANFLASRSALEATRQVIPQARANLLPQISANVQRTQNDTVNRQKDFFGNYVDQRFTNYPSDYRALTLQQPLFRKYNWAQFFLAEAQVAASEAGFEKDRQDTGLRVAGAYFDVLTSQSRVGVLQTQVEAYVGQQNLAERAFKAGQAARTDIDEARARVLAAKALLVEAQYNVDNTRRALAALIGAMPGPLADVVPSRLDLAPPQPASVDEWLRESEEGNPELASLRHQVDMAKQDVERQRSGFFPTIVFVAARQYGASQYNFNINTAYWTTYYGVQASIPIFSSGSVVSAVRQARSNVDKAQYQFDAALARIGAETQKYFAGVLQGEEKVRAYESALEAAETAVASTRKGFQGGVNTQVDVLNALQRVAAEKLALTQARYDLLMDRLRLAADVGRLGDEFFAQINKSLGQP